MCVSYLVPRKNALCAIDEGKSHGEVCSPHHQTQQRGPFLSERLGTDQHKHAQEHTQRGANHGHKRYMVGHFLNHTQTQT